ncbi:ZIP family metal transporter [Cellulosilyticum sp. ST5]|uniref:Zinc/iron permease n=1 Tax=Cellulosilyticum lentocellum (strain ATCC 49066 / DSM 5427 / NCIMB 11756 / RHM5) TaxID=642492 RepID=F2JKV8_CELLD|nr:MULTISPECIES: ZIP family metal transporter [Cellulosilyticum]ADZ83361.1 zinc/iron permease [Cellulosilyticum lentocellum DSM 5427]QEH68826.1 ZIP family metal transporter [Cellulosilyticum sp. WCF-2]
MELVRVGTLGLLAEGGGLSFGILLLYLFHIKNERLIGMLFGGTSGLMLAMICFDILPEALEKGRIDLVFVGIIMGVLLGTLLDDFVPEIQKRLGKKNSPLSKMGLILAVGIALHNLPEGFALGTISNVDNESIFHFTLILALHSVPEGIALSIPFKQGGIQLSKMLFIAMGLGICMGIGAVGGFVLSSMSENLVSTGLGIAAGIILYIICEELLPESKKIWNGRMTTIATILGMMLGLLLLY